MNVEVKVTTDNYPGETSWTLTNQCNGQLAATGGTYSQANTLHTFTKCLPTAMYAYTINDAYGDGNCCGYGTGSYAVVVDGNTAFTGGTFGASETKSFGTCGVSPTIP